MTRSLLDRDVSLAIDESSLPKRSSSVSAVRRDVPPPPSGSLLYEYTTMNSTGGASNGNSRTGGLLGTRSVTERAYPPDDDRVFFPTNQLLSNGQVISASRTRHNLQSAPSSQQGQLITSDLYSLSSGKIDPTLIQKRIERKKELETIYNVESNVKKMLIPTYATTQTKKRPRRQVRSQSTKPGTPGLFGALPRIAQTPNWNDERSPPKHYLSSQYSQILHPSEQMENNSRHHHLQNNVQPPAVNSNITYSFDDEIDFENDFRDGSSSSKERNDQSKEFKETDYQDNKVRLSEASNHYLSPNHAVQSQMSNLSGRLSQGDRRRSISGASSMKSVASTISPVKQTHQISVKKNQLEFLEKSLDLKKRQESQLDLAIRIQKRQLQLLRRRLKIHQEKEAASKAAMEKYQSVGNPNNLLLKLDEANKLLDSKEKRLQSLANDLQEVQRMSEEKQHHLTNLEQNLKSDIDSIQERLQQLKDLEKNVKKKQRDATLREMKVKSLEEQLQKRMELNENKCKEIAVLESRLQEENKLNKDKRMTLKEMENSLLHEKEQLSSRRESLAAETMAFQNELKENESRQRKQWEDICKLRDELSDLEKLYEALLGIDEEEKKTFGSKAIESRIQELNSIKKKYKPPAESLNKIVQHDYQAQTGVECTQTDSTLLNTIYDEFKRTIETMKKVAESQTDEIIIESNDTSKIEAQLPINQVSKDIQALKDAVLSSGEKNAQFILTHIDDELKFYSKAEKLEKELIALQLQHQAEFDRIKVMLSAKESMSNEDLNGLRGISENVKVLGTEYQNFSNEIHDNISRLTENCGSSPIVEDLVRRKKGLASKVENLKKVVDNIHERDERDINLLIDALSRPQNSSESSTGDSGELEVAILKESLLKEREKVQKLMRDGSFLHKSEKKLLENNIKVLCEDSDKRIEFQKELMHVEDEARRRIKEKIQLEKDQSNVRENNYRDLSQVVLEAKLSDLNSLSTSLSDDIKRMMSTNSSLSAPLVEEFKSLRTLRRNLEKQLEDVDTSSNPSKKEIEETLKDLIHKIKVLESREDDTYKTIMDRARALNHDVENILVEQKSRLQEKAQLDAQRQSNDAEYKKDLQNLDTLWNEFRNNHMQSLSNAHSEFTENIKEYEKEWSSLFATNLGKQEELQNQYESIAEGIESTIQEKLNTLSKESLSPAEQQLEKVAIYQERQNLLQDAEQEKMNRMKILTNEALQSLNELESKKAFAVDTLNKKLLEIEAEKNKKMKEILDLENDFEKEYESRSSSIALQDRGLDDKILKRISELESKQQAMEKERLAMHSKLEDELRTLQQELQTRSTLQLLTSKLPNSIEMYTPTMNVDSVPDKHVAQGLEKNQVNSSVISNESHNALEISANESLENVESSKYTDKSKELVEVLASAKFSAATLDFLATSLQDVIEKSSQLQEIKNTSTEPTHSEEHSQPPTLKDFDALVESIKTYDHKTLLEEIQNTKDKAIEVLKKLTQLQDIDTKKEKQFSQEIETLTKEKQLKIQEADAALEKYSQLEELLAKTREDASVVDEEVQKFSQFKQEYEEKIKSLENDLRLRTESLNDMKEILEQEQQTIQKMIAEKELKSAQNVQLEQNQDERHQENKYLRESQQLTEENAKNVYADEKERFQLLEQELNELKQKEESRKQIYQSVDDVIQLKEDLQRRERILFDEEQNLAKRIEHQNELASRFESKLREEQAELNERLQNLLAREQELELLYSKLTARLNDVRTEPENNHLPYPRNGLLDLSTTQTVSLGATNVSEKRIIYLSQMVSVADCESIVSESSIFNRENNITGLLICSESAFIHMIEGPSKDVNLLYRKIVQDRRHQDIHCIKVEDDISARLCNAPMRLVKTSTNLLSIANSDLLSYSSSPSNRSKSPRQQSSLQVPSPTATNRLSPSSQRLSPSSQRFYRDDSNISQPLLQVVDSILTSFRCLEKYVPPTVVNMCKSNINPLILPIFQHERIIMLVDVVRFSVKPRSDEVKSLMAKYLSITRKCVTKYRGDVIQYSGNSVIAVFEADQANEALKATLLLYKTILAKMPMDSSNRNASLLQLGVFLSQGEVLEGSFGCGAQMSYHIVGEHVQRAWQISSQLHKQKYLFVFDNSIRSGLKKQESLYDAQVKHVGTIQIQNNRSVELYSLPGKSVLLNPMAPSSSQGGNVIQSIRPSSTASPSAGEET